MIASLFFVVQHAAALALILIVAAATGTAVAGARWSLALRSILGLAIAGQILVLLGAAGWVQLAALIALAAIAIAAGAMRNDWRKPHWRPIAAIGALSLPPFVLALFPPIAFDETTYHLPFIRAIATSGAVRFQPGLRFPIFPELHELLCVPPFLALGDMAPHLMSVAQVILLVALLRWWLPGRAGALAAALVMGSPVVVHHATIAYTESALMLFVAAGFACIDRAARDDDARLIAAAGLLLGTACSVKYLGGYFALAGLVAVALLPARRRLLAPFVLALLAATAPMYAQIMAATGNPVFPLLPSMFGESPWAHPVVRPDHPAMRALRLFWDISFARERVNQQPPYSPFFALSFLTAMAIARRNRRAAFVSAIVAIYVALFVTVMPATDSRYLMALIPLVSVVAAPVLARRRVVAATLAALSIAAGLAYAAYRFGVLGAPPLDAESRRAFLERKIPEYRALERRPPGRIYVCGAEQLQYYGHGELLGDVIGPMSNAKVLGGRDAVQLWRFFASSGIRSYLVSRRCPEEWGRVPKAPYFEEIYGDAGAVLFGVRWRQPPLSVPHETKASKTPQLVRTEAALRVAPDCRQSPSTQSANLPRVQTVLLPAVDVP